LTTVLIGIELNQYKGVWKGKKSSRCALQLLPFFSVIYKFNNSSIMEGDWEIELHFLYSHLL